MANNMNTRREVIAMTLSATAVASVNPVQAAGQTYDLVIKGGRVIDPARRFNAVADVAMRWGRIVAVAPNISPGYAEVLDATGKLVTPGLIDVHSHFTPGGGGGAGRGGRGGAGRGGAAAGRDDAAVAQAQGAQTQANPALTPQTPGAAAAPQAPALPGPNVVLSDGCTGWIEAGSRGADNIEVEKPVILAAPQVAAALVNIGRHGMGGAQTDT
jgi:predicted amidohydrolase